MIRPAHQFNMPLATPWPIRILGTGHYLPHQVITSEQLDAQWGRPPGTALRQVGVARRHFSSAQESSSFMAARAAEQALAAAALRADELDLIVSACAVMEQAIPCLGAQVQRALGLGASGIPAFDVNATCLSFVAALELAASLLLTGRYRRVLIVSSEVASAGLNPDAPGIAALFGDGAAAAVLGLDEASPSGVLATRLMTYGEGADHCQIRGGGTRQHQQAGALAPQSAHWFEMDGRATYRLAAQHFPGFLGALLADADVSLTEIDWFVPHQASGKALDHLTRLLSLPARKIVRTLPEVGNQVAASLPNALHQAIADGRIQRGQTVALLGSGAGLSIGGAVLRY